MNDSEFFLKPARNMQRHSIVTQSFCKMFGATAADRLGHQTLKLELEQRPQN